MLRAGMYARVSTDDQQILAMQIAPCGSMLFGRLFRVYVPELYPNQRPGFIVSRRQSLEQCCVELLAIGARYEELLADEGGSCAVHHRERDEIRLDIRLINNWLNPCQEALELCAADDGRLRVWRLVIGIWLTRPLNAEEANHGQLVALDRQRDRRHNLGLLA